MLVDEYEKYNHNQQNVANINADETVEDAETVPMADDCTLTLFSRRPSPLSSRGLQRALGPMWNTG